MEERLVGHVSVDSGLVLLIDPCYLHDWKHGEFDITDGRTVADAKNNYDECCLRVGADEVGPVFNGSAVASGTTHGDGRYPVFATFESGRIASLRIDFLFDENAGEEEDEEDEDDWAALVDPDDEDDDWEDDEFEDEEE